MRSPQSTRPAAAHLPTRGGAAVPAQSAAWVLRGQMWPRSECQLGHTRRRRNAFTYALALDVHRAAHDHLEGLAHIA
eukprot:2102386-Prymnesium_polylepis.2